MVDEPGVEDLVDAGDGRPPRADPLARLGHHARIVQDRSSPSDLDGVDADGIPPGRVVNELLAIAAFALAGTVSPGPNNSVLWVSGMVFGFRRTLPHVVGTALGMGALLLGVAAGIGALLDAVPMAETALKVAGSVYLLYLAVLVARSGGVGRAVVPRPLSRRAGGGVPVGQPEGVDLLDHGRGHLRAPDALPAPRCRATHRHHRRHRRRVVLDLGGRRGRARATRRRRTDPPSDRHGPRRPARRLGRRSSGRSTVSDPEPGRAVDSRSPAA